jgi:phage terminase large subunit
MEILTTKIYREVEQAYREGYTTLSAQGSARCFAEGTLVRMYDGRLKAVQLIEIGDKVMNIQGDGYNTVISTHKGNSKLYKVKQKRGVDYIVNENHILSLKQTRTQGRKIAIEGYKSAEKRKWVYEPFDKEKIHDFDVKYFTQQSEKFRLKYTGFKNTMCHLPEKETMIDPYYLGMWLGDGCSIRPHEITNIDNEIKEWFYDFAKTLDTYAYKVDAVTHRFMICEEGTKNKSLKGKTREFRDSFRDYDLIKNKHIPEDYIYNSYENRLKLLAGLIDSDWCSTGRKTISISQKNRRILEGVLEICRISGFYTNGIIEVNANMKRANGTLYKSKAYSIEINHSNFKDLNKYIKVPRKRIEGKDCNRNYFSTTISIENAGVGDYFGFELDNSPYFTIEDGTVCHNSSKTYNIVIWIITFCLLNQGTRISIVRGTLPALKGSVLVDFKEIMMNMLLWDSKQFNKSELVYTFPNGSWIEFFSTDNEQKLRGRKRDILFANEANELTALEFQQLKLRTTKFSIIDYNPSFTDEHWINKLNKDQRTKHVLSTYKDNPFLEQTIIDEIESLRTKNDSLWKIYGLGIQAAIEGLIFKNIEIIDEYPFVKNNLYGMDFGFTNDPSTAVKLSIDGSRKNVYVDEVFYRTHMLTSDIIKELKINNINRIISESADPRMIQEIKNAGINAIPVDKYQGSVKAGITKMLEYRFCITRRSTNIIKEFRNYTYQQDKEGKWLNLPIDAFNHAIDAIRYIFLTEILGKGKRIKDLTGIFY